MAEGTAPAARSLGWSRTLGFLNPLRAVWWLFTNVRFAIFLLVLLSTVSLVGVLVPQVPATVRGDALLEADWLDAQRDNFGFLTTSMDRAGVFDVFHARWFALLLAVTVASTGAYVVSRFPGVWQAITRPRKRVPERYFDVAPNRAEAEGLDAARLEAALRRGRYRVERFEEGETTYLFADRFAWAQLGSLLTHAAIIVFILSAVVSRIDSFSSPLFLGEGQALPVFPVRDPNQLQVELVDAHAAYAADGQPLDYRSEMVIYRNGEEVARCQSTVNTPCEYGGYRLYQAAYFGFGAQLQVRDTASGNLVYDETLALTDKLPAPYVSVRDAAGNVLLDEYVSLPESVEANGETYLAGLVRVGGRPFTFWLPEGGDLLVFEPGSGDAVQVALAEGQTAESGGLTVTYVKEGVSPAGVVPDVPLPESAGGGSGDALLQLSNVVYGTNTASEGTGAEGPAGGAPAKLTLVGLQAQPLTLAPGESAQIGGYEYTFAGQREFAGIDVKRDRSDYLVWAGAAFTVLGLMITFWVPRRRFWAKIAGTGPDGRPYGRAWLVGQAATHANYTRELRRLAAEAGGSVAGIAEDDD